MFGKLPDPWEGFLDPSWPGRASHSFASGRAAPRGHTKGDPHDRQDWEAKIRWERGWQRHQTMVELGAVHLPPPLKPHSQFAAGSISCV